MKVISLHVPKCAGSSFSGALVDALGHDRVYLDYSEGPGNPTSPPNIDPKGSRRRFQRHVLPDLEGKTVAHGHFDVAKYLPLFGRARFITVLREPVDRLISHYFFWKQPTAGMTRILHPVRSYMLDHDLSLEAFSELPMVRWFYTKTFFRDFDMRNFDYIASTQRFATDLSRLEEIIGVKLKLGFKNTGDRPVIPAETVRTIQKNLEEDIDFYHRWSSIS